tara:strand:- start:2194 stop:2715 length:522 start_codon:yes stop_codon:yes gene_type:complete
MKTSANIIMMIAVAALLAACDGAEPPTLREDPEDSFNGRLLEDDSIMDIFRSNPSSGALEGGAIPVNAYLWRASLDTLEFLPLTSTDPFSGVIVTDWSTNAATPNERFKVTVYIDSPKLEANALRVAVYRELQGQGGTWTSAEVSDATPRRIEDAILTRARQLRVAALQAEES